jgi:signal transduction histidine kinase
MKIGARLSLMQQMLAGGGVILLAGMVIVGTWVGREIESGVVRRAGLVTALYVDSFVSPFLQSLAGGGELREIDRDDLDNLLAATSLGKQIVVMKVWSPGGRVSYSNNRDLVGRSYPDKPMLSAAFAGKANSHITTLDDPEHEVERRNWPRLIETYVPVRRSGTDTVIAVAEFYQRSDDLVEQVAAARLRSWLMVGAATLTMSLLLAALVRRASNTIVAQQGELREKVSQLTATLDQNEKLRERVQRAGARTTALNEQFLHRLAADIHDGPGQGVALALMRLEPMMDLCGSSRTAACGDRAVDVEFRTLQSALQSALDDLRAISRGLHLPEIGALSLAETVQRAVRDYERKVGGAPAVTVEAGELPVQAPLSVKITLFRLLQETLANGFRHGGATAQRITLAVRDGELQVEVADDGRGFDPGKAGADGHLGIEGMRERVQILGGTFGVRSAPDRGTVVRASLPLSGLEDGDE